MKKLDGKIAVQSAKDIRGPSPLIAIEDVAVLEFFEKSSRNLLAAEAIAGVDHHVALSVVGADRIPDSGYMRAKAAQEKLIKSGGVPYTILRATQFFEFMGAIAQSATDEQTVRLPSAFIQPIMSDDVAAALVDITLGEPVNGIIELAGPDRLHFDELIRRFLSANHVPVRSSQTPKPAISAQNWTIALSFQETNRLSVRPVSRTGLTALSLKPL
ncbi:hypothetical protein [Nostoc sp. JL31]|uniref:SDR family oxidoreductase n=1 Tax=Nostoc sp. JL31 TaxID=2815395 RepID=UPI0025EA5DA9|nr:hypothetical protein [Nostoc sp. JL31]